MNSNELQALIDEVQRRFEYSEIHQGLVYKVWFNGLPKEKVGCRVGYTNPRGYKIVRVLGKFYREHQLVWLIFNKELIVGSKESCLDHIDNDKENCLITNLRKVSQRENTRNRTTTSRCGANISLTSANTYYAYVDHSGKRIGLWTHKTLEMANSVLNYYKSLGEESIENALATREHFRKRK